jgi:hypothetical protein
MNISEIISTNRPTLSTNSVKTYTSTLGNLLNKLNINNTEDLAKSKSDVIKYLEDKPPSRRKSVLSALFILTGDKEYQTHMMNDITHYKTEVNTQEKNEKQEAYWISELELNTKINNLETVAKQLYTKSKKQSLTMSELQQIQNYIIVLLYTMIQPRRSLDYTEMKINKESASENENYIDNKHFIFRKFKTSKFYGEQKELIPKQLLSIINKWIKISRTILGESYQNYLLFDINGNKLTSPKLTQRLNVIFGKKIGTSALRHLYISHKYGDIIQTQNEMKNDLEAMGSSIAQEKVYNKK